MNRDLSNPRGNSLKREGGEGEMGKRYKPRHLAPKNLGQGRTPAAWCDVAKTFAIVVGVLIDLIQLLRG